MTSGPAPVRDWAIRQARTVGRAGVSAAPAGPATARPARFVPDRDPVDMPDGADVVSAALLDLPDGIRLLATGERYGRVHLREPDTGRITGSFAGLSGTVWGVALAATAGGQPILAAGGADDTAHLWDPVTGQHLHTLTGHTDLVRSVAMGTLPDGTTLLATASYDRTARIWNTATGQHLHTLTGHTGEVRSAAFGTLRDGTPLLATTASDRTARIWNAATGQHLHTLTGHTDNVQSAAFGTLPDGTTLLATTGYDRTARIWNAATGQHLHTFTGHTDQVQSVAFAVLPDGRPLVMTSDGFVVRFWDPGDGHPANTVPTDSVWFVAAAVGPDGALQLVTVGDPDLARMYRLSPEPSGPALEVGGTDELNFGPESVATLSAGAESLFAESFGALPDGTVLISVRTHDGVQIWNAVDGQHLQTLTGHTGTVWSAAFGTLPDGTPVLATGSRDHTARIWNPVTGQHQHTLTGHTAEVWSTAFGTLPEGTTLLATASYDNTARIWNAATGQHLHTLTGHTDNVQSAAFGTLPDGTPVLATAGDDRTARIWNTATGQHLHTLTGHTSGVASVAFGTLPDGAPVLATASRDQTARLWNAATGQHLRTLTGHTDGVRSVAFGTLPDGTTLLATGGRDALRIWHPATGRHLHTAAAVSFAAPTWDPFAGSRIWIANDRGGSVEVLTISVRRRSGDRRSTGPAPAVPAAAFVRLTAAGVPTTLGLLTDLAAMIGGATPVDPRLTPVGAHAGTGRLRSLGWPRLARPGLAALLAGDLPAEAAHQVPDTDPGTLLRELGAALRSPVVPPQLPQPPVLGLLAAAEQIDDRLLALLAILGPDAVAADPVLPLRLRDRAALLPPMDARRRTAVADVAAVATRGSQADPVRHATTSDGINRHGRITAVLPTQRTLPPSLFALRYAAGDLLYRQYRTDAAGSPEPVTIVLDTTPATFGPPETVLRLVAHLITVRLWASHRQPVLVSVDQADRSTVLGGPDQLAAMWSTRSLHPPDLRLALTTAVRHARTPVVVLTEHHAARDAALRPGPVVRLLTTHMPGDPPRRAPGSPFHIHLPPGADPATLARAAARLLAEHPRVAGDLREGRT